MTDLFATLGCDLQGAYAAASRFADEALEATPTRFIEGAEALFACRLLHRAMCEAGGDEASRSAAAQRMAMEARDKVNDPSLSHLPIQRGGWLIVHITLMAEARTPQLV